jgi:hypothetical protein
MYPHRIRLRGPWECEPIDGPPPRRVFMPSGWLAAGLGGFHGAARFTRKFGYPGQIDDGEHIWLTCDGCTGCREVRLNGQILTQNRLKSFTFDVTSLLSQRNQLGVLIHGDTEDAGLWGEVALEVRRDAYLADVNIVRADQGFTVLGRAIGTSPQPLELYTLIDNRHTDYRTIQPKPAGEPFRIELPEVTSLNQAVRVELIHISAIWYVVEMPIPS